MHHLDRCGEMLGPMLATIHNLHFYLNLMQEVCDALDARDFTGFVERFKGDRARGGLTIGVLATFKGGLVVMRPHAQDPHGVL